MSEHPRARLYLARHCDVHNPDRVLYGHLPGFRLSDRGVAQAHAMGRYLRDRDIAVIRTSPLQRAQETTDIIASYLGGVPVEVDDDLVEARFGAYLQGVPAKKVPYRRPLWFVHMVWPGLLPHDETVGAMAARVGRALTRVLDEHPARSGVCVSHGDPIQAFWLRAEHRRVYALHRLQCAKGGVLELDYEGTRLLDLTYHSPQMLGESPAPPLAGASHA